MLTGTFKQRMRLKFVHHWWLADYCFIKMWNHSKIKIIIKNQPKKRKLTWQADIHLDLYSATLKQWNYKISWKVFIEVLYSVTDLAKWSPMKNMGRKVPRHQKVRELLIQINFTMLNISWLYCTVSSLQNHSSKYQDQTHSDTLLTVNKFRVFSNDLVLVFDLLFKYCYSCFQLAYHFFLFMTFRL